MPLNRTVTVSNTRYIKDDINSYSENVINVAKEVNANFILLSFTGTSGKTEKWQWKLLPDFIQKAHDQGLQVSFYMKLTNLMWKPLFFERPESKDWIMVYQDGTPALYLGAPYRYLGCLNNPGWRKFLKEMIDSAIGYGPDALFYDNCFIPSMRKGSREEGSAEAWACYCDTCRQHFRSYTGETLGWECALPEVPDWDDPVWQAFIKFRDKAVVDTFKMVVDHAHHLKPDILVYPNVAPPYHGGGGAKGSATSEVAEVVDLLLFEKADPPRAGIPPEGGLPRPITAAIDWKYGSALGNTPVWYRLNNPEGPYPPDRVRLGMAEASAFNGANHHIMTTALMAEPDKAEGIKRTYNFLEAHEEYYTGVRPVADVAVLVSTPTNNWYIPDRATRGAEIPQNTRGIGQALAELHVPFNVVLDEHIEKDDLPYRVLILPNAACMSDRQAGALVRFVERGGGLVATGHTSLYDENYRIRKDFALSGLFGLHYGQEADDLVKTPCGEGLCAYLPGTPEEDFRLGGNPEVLHRIKQALAYTLRDNWQLQVDAPSTTVINLTEKSETGMTLLHLINFETARRVVDIDVQLRKPDGRSLRKVQLISPDFKADNLSASEDTGTVRFTVPRLDIYDLIAIDWK